MTDQSPIDARPNAVAALFVRHPLWEDALALLFGTPWWLWASPSTPMRGC